MSCLAINEPDCFINNFYNTGVQTIEMLKDFILGFCNDKSKLTSEDDRLSVGILIMEYLMPLMEDSYFFESQFVRFLQQIVLIDRQGFIDVLFKIFSLSFTDEYLKKWTMHLMHACSREVLLQPLSTLNVSCIDNFLKLIIHILARDRFKAAWLASPYFYQDLEKLYSMHLPSTQEWKKILQVLYHPLLKETFANKVKYERNFKKIRDSFDA